MQEIRSNQQLEQDVRIMDIKIGLLVKNRISLEDVVTHSSKIKKERRKGGASAAATGDSSTMSTTGLGGLTKANQQRIEVLGRGRGGERFYMIVLVCVLTVGANLFICMYIHVRTCVFCRPISICSTCYKPILTTLPS